MSDSAVAGIVYSFEALKLGLLPRSFRPNRARAGESDACLKCSSAPRGTGKSQRWLANAGHPYVEVKGQDPDTNGDETSERGRRLYPEWNPSNNWFVVKYRLTHHRPPKVLNKMVE